MRAPETNAARPRLHAPEFVVEPRRKPFLVSSADSLFRNSAKLFVIWGLVTLAAAAYWKLTPGEYESEMTFLVRNSRSDVVVSADGSSSSPQKLADVSDAQMATEVQILSSRELAERLIPAAAGPAASNKQRESALAGLRKNLIVAPVVKSNMIRVRYSNADPKRVTAVLDALASAYVSEHLQLHGNAGSEGFFEGEAEQAESRWKDAQRKLSDFRQREGVSNVAAQKDLLLTRQNELETALHQAEADLRDAIRRIESMRPRLAGMAQRVETQNRRVPNQYSAERLNTLLAELRNRRTDLVSKYLPNDRQVIQLDRQISDTEGALSEVRAGAAREDTSDINPLRQSLENELSRSESAEAGLRGRIEAMRAQNSQYLARLNKLDRLAPDEQQLSRETKIAEDSYLLYAKRREEAIVGRRMDEQKMANVVLAERPRQPTAPKSRLGSVIPLFILGIVLGTLAVLLTASRKAEFTPWALEAATGIPVLGTVPVRKASAGRGAIRERA